MHHREYGLNFGDGYGSGISQMWEIIIFLKYIDGHIESQFQIRIENTFIAL